MFSFSTLLKKVIAPWNSPFILNISSIQLQITSTSRQTSYFNFIKDIFN